MNKFTIGIEGAMGDHLCCTPLIRNIKKKFPKMILKVICLYPWIFENNPYIDKVTTPRENDTKFKIDIYEYGFKNYYYGSYSAAACDAWGSPYDGDELDYFSTLEEDANAQTYAKRFKKPIILIATGAGCALQDGKVIKISSNRDWFDEYWEEVCKDLRKKYSLIQIGAKQEKPLKNVEARLLGEPLREVIPLLKFCKLWISVDSFWQHVGSAMKKKGVVLFGKTIPNIAGHHYNFNIYKNACSTQECHWDASLEKYWLLEKGICDNKKCMKAIKPKEIINIVNHWNDKVWLEKKQKEYKVIRPDENRIEIGIPTADRHQNLFGLLTTLRNQTFKNWDITIIDDGDDESLIHNYCVMHTLELLSKEGHRWRLLRAKEHKGPPFAHNKVLYGTDHKYVFRVDDDVILPPNYLEQLYKIITSNDKIGAVSGLVLHLPDLTNYYPKDYMTNWQFANIESKRNPVKNICLQWLNHPDNKDKEVSHLYSSYLYRAEYGRKIGGFARDLSAVGHTEETQFSFQLFLEGYKLIVTPKVKAFHYRTPRGGIRNKRYVKEMWDSDIVNFMVKYKKWKQKYNLKNWE